MLLSELLDKTKTVLTLKNTSLKLIKNMTLLEDTQNSHPSISMLAIILKASLMIFQASLVSSSQVEINHFTKNLLLTPMALTLLR